MAILSPVQSPTIWIGLAGQDIAPQRAFRHESDAASFLAGGSARAGLYWPAIGQVVPFARRVTAVYQSAVGAPNSPARPEIKPQDDERGSVRAAPLSTDLYRFHIGALLLWIFTVVLRK